MACGEVRRAALLRAVELSSSSWTSAGPVAQLGEQHAAVVADPQHPPGHRDRRLSSTRRGPERPCGWAAGRPDRRRFRCPAMSSAWPSARAPARAAAACSSTSAKSALQLAERPAREPSWCNSPVATSVCGTDEVMAGVLFVAPGERQHQEALGDRPRRRRPAGPAGRPRSTRTAAPTRAGTSCSSGTASPAATSARRTPADRATAARPGRRRVGRPARTPTGTSRSSAKSG